LREELEHLVGGRQASGRTRARARGATICSPEGGHAALAHRAMVSMAQCRSCASGPLLQRESLERPAPMTFLACLRVSGSVVAVQRQQPQRNARELRQNTGRLGLVIRMALRTGRLPMIQRALLAASEGTDLGPTGADGIYGPGLAAAVMKFKSDKGLGSSQFGDVARDGAPPRPDSRRQTWTTPPCPAQQKSLLMQELWFRGIGAPQPNALIPVSIVGTASEHRTGLCVPLARVLLIFKAGVMSRTRAS